MSARSAILKMSKPRGFQKKIIKFVAVSSENLCSDNLSSHPHWYISIFDLRSPRTLQKIIFHILKNPLFKKKTILSGSKSMGFLLLSESNMREDLTVV